MNVPECLNKELFEKVLKSGFKLQNFKLISFDITPGSSAGDNYCSTIYRVVIIYHDESGREKKVQCIVKFILNSDMGKAMLEKSKVYEKELDMLENVLPKLSTLTGGTILGPKMYYTIDEENTKIIVMEDLGEDGHKMADRKLLLDYNHCELVLKKLGEMHAASMVLAQEDPSIMDPFDCGVLNGSVEEPGIVQQCLSGNYPMLCKIVKTWPGYEDIANKLEKMMPTIWEIFYDCSQRKHDGYRVLNHGDFWINNFLFKYDEKTGKPVDCVFVDLQFSYYSSPAHDLQYFFNCSPTLEVRDNQREALLRVYYGAFCHTLEAHKQRKIPTFDDLLEEMKKREMYGFFAAVYILPVILMERQSEQGSGIEGLVNEDSAIEMLNIMFTGKRYTEATKSFLKRFDELKVFDI